MTRNQIVQTPQHFSAYLPIISYFWGLKQVFAGARRNDNRNIQAGLAFVLRQFIKATRHSIVPWEWKTTGQRRGIVLEFWRNHQKPSEASGSQKNPTSLKVLCCPMLCLCQDFLNSSDFQHVPFWSRKLLKTLQYWKGLSGAFPNQFPLQPSGGSMDISRNLSLLTQLEVSLLKSLFLKRFPMK